MQVQAFNTVWTFHPRKWATSLGLPLGLEAPVITPHGVIFLLFEGLINKHGQKAGLL